MGANIGALASAALESPPPAVKPRVDVRVLSAPQTTPGGERFVTALARAFGATSRRPRGSSGKSL